MKVQVTPEIMTKVWNLHTHEVDNKLIAETLGISQTSASRIITIMTAAQNGEDVDSIGGNNHQRQKVFAKQFFGLTEKEVKVEEVKVETQEEKQNSDDITKDFMQRVLLALAWQNQLLEQLLHSLGVDCGTFSKGVETR